jgi:hypothetical protein
MELAILYNRFFVKKALLFLAMTFLFACSKSIEEPKHENKGRNFVYLKVDETEHLIHDGLHFNKAAKGEIWGYDEYDYKPRVETGNINGKETFDVKVGFRHKDYYPVSASYVSLEMLRSNDGFVLQRLGLSVIAYSAKHKKKVQIYDFDIKPRSFQIEKLDEKKQKIALTFLVDYTNIADKSDSGTFYFYMDADYATYKKR